MQVLNSQLFLQIVRLLCPHLKDMAARTENRVDDAVVNFMCEVAGASDDEK
jgi:hypothetical protein